MKVYIICKSATPVLWWIAEQQFYSYSSEVLIHDQRVWRPEITGQLAPVSAPLSEPGPGPMEVRHPTIQCIHGESSETETDVGIHLD